MDVGTNNDNNLQGKHIIKNELHDEVIDLCSPEPDVHPTQALDNVVTSRNLNMATAHVTPTIKREATDDLEGTMPKRAKGKEADADDRDPFLAAMNAAIGQYREKDQAERRTLKDMVNNLKLELKQSRNSLDQLQSQVPDHNNNVTTSTEGSEQLMPGRDRTSTGNMSTADSGPSAQSMIKSYKDTLQSKNEELK